jgi:hypothetical protein
MWTMNKEMKALRARLAEDSMRHLVKNEMVKQAVVQEVLSITIQQVVEPAVPPEEQLYFECLKFSFLL